MRHWWLILLPLLPSVPSAIERNTIVNARADIIERWRWEKQEIQKRKQMKSIARYRRERRGSS